MSLYDVKTGKNVGEKASTKKEAKKILKKEIAKKMTGHKGGFIDRLEAHKREAASFDNGTWKPSKKGESFIDALERHKANREFY